MGNSPDEKKLKFPVSRQAFPEPRELSMDDYYEFVVSNLKLFGKPPLERSAGFQRFVIRDDGDEYSTKK